MDHTNFFLSVGSMVYLYICVILRSMNVLLCSSFLLFELCTFGESSMVDVMLFLWRMAIDLHRAIV
jgi:hypothetical protein